MDRKWCVWREPYYPRRWYVNEATQDVTEVAEGFATKREAVEFLEKLLKKKNLAQ